MAATAARIDANKRKPLTMLIRSKPDIRPSEITPDSSYVNRRHFIRSATLAGSSLLFAAGCSDANDSTAEQQAKLALDINSFEDVTSYNNFYEFGLDKKDPARYSDQFKAKPWSVTVDGEAEITGTFDFEDIIKPHTIEERIYRFRCVEAWSMVVPWNGFPLGDLLKRFKPTSKAKYVTFETVYRPAEMPGQRAGVLDFPYLEGLTIAEAMHPLTLMVPGLYGVDLRNQNGAPLRLIVPWKYGFKSIKSIARISFTETRPRTSWNDTASAEYGFYANVNPEVDHPRWSQARERRIGRGLFAEKEPTLMFNGYADEVASLYTGLDLSKYF